MNQKDPSIMSLPELAQSLYEELTGAILWQSFNTEYFVSILRTDRLAQAQKLTVEFVRRME